MKEKKISIKLFFFAIKKKFLKNFFNHQRFMNRFNNNETTFCRFRWNVENCKVAVLHEKPRFPGGVKTPQNGGLACVLNNRYCGGVDPHWVGPILQKCIFWCFGGPKRYFAKTPQKPRNRQNRLFSVFWQNR